MKSELEKLKEAQEIQRIQHEMEREKERREEEELQREIRIQKDLADAPDDKIIGKKWAMIMLGVKTEKTLKRMIDAGLEEVAFKDHGEINKETGEKNQGKNYDKRFEVGTLRKYIRDHRQVRKGALTVKCPDHASFATLQDLFQPLPFWIQTIATQKKGGMGRGTIQTTHQVIVGHLFTLNQERAKQAVQDLHTDICDLTLDEAMKMPWASQAERQPFQDSYIRVLQQAIEAAELQGA